MPIFRSNPKIEKNQFTTNGRILWVPAIQNGYMAAPALTMDVDYSTFKKTKEERLEIAVRKSKNELEVAMEFGAGSKKLNCSRRSIGKSIRATF